MTEETKACSLERTIIGFDIRKSSSLNNLFMTSYDEDVRFEDIYEKFQEYLSGLNLFFVDPSSIKTLEIPMGARIIAFDLPSDVVAYLESGNVSNPKPLPKINTHREWDFVGFDVVDPITQTSAFHGFDFPFSMEKLVEPYSVAFNNYGLLENGECAAKVAKFFNNLIPEHAPFSPCGIWLKQEKEVKG